MAEPRILFVGDIQGCSQELAELLETAGFRPGEDRLIPVGDTINRGPDAPGVLQQLLTLGAEPIIGNHEMSLLQKVEKGALPDWDDRHSALTQIMEAAMLEEAVEWIKSWPYYRQGPGWVVVHAGLHPLLPVEATPADFLVRVRFCDEEGVRPDYNDNKLADPPEGLLPWYHYYKGDRVVIFGHWAIRGLILQGKLRGLDSGCVYGGELTGLWWPEDKIVQVPSHQPYRRKPPLSY